MVGLPDVEEVCRTFELNDVDIDFTEQDYQTIDSYKVFQQHVRHILQKENPKVPMSKVMMLVAAKWRAFREENPHLQDEGKDDEGSSEYQGKPSRSRASKSEKVNFITNCNLLMTCINNDFLIYFRAMKFMMTKRRRRKRKKSKDQRRNVAEALAKRAVISKLKFQR